MLSIAERRVEELVRCLNCKNPRSISKEQQKALQSSLVEFGCVEPIVFNLRTQQVVGGHQRIQAADLQGIETLPVVEIDLDLKAETALNIALNKIKGEWDYGKLAILMADVISEEDLRLTGFAPAEIESIVASYNRDATTIEGAYEKLTNKSSEEVEANAYETVRCQLGIYQIRVDRQRYDRWLESLGGSSPVELGREIARRLNLKGA
jgi:hypothetical protein